MMTEAEKQKTQARAERDARDLSLLLLVLLKEGRSPVTAAVTWDAQTGTFIYRGRPVAAASVRKFLLRIEDRFAARIIALTTKLEKGDITLEDWQSEFEGTIASAHVLSAAFALGGIALAVNNLVVQRQITQQWGFARGFVKDIKRRRDPLSFARIRARAKSYIQAAHITFSNVELEVVKLTGVKTEARNILRPAEHCQRRERPGCPEITAAGWLPVEDMTPIGKRQCSIYCRCFLEYR